MNAAFWNLIAAVLCTIAAAITAIVAVLLYLADGTLINLLAVAACGVGALGGGAWIVAAAMGVREQ